MSRLINIKIVIKHSAGKLLRVILATRYQSILILLTALTFSSCNSPGHKTEKKTASKEILIRANQAIVKTEGQRIADYIERRQWGMITTPTGLRYMIYKHGKGTLIQPKQKVTFNFDVHLLDGTLCYQSKDIMPKTIALGKGEIERGLEEGILLLKKGDRAKFIIPSHLAFGLVGDGNKIPAKATLVYDIEITEFN